eukprot:Sdes_comp18943_c0_seq3m9437
MLSSLLSPKTMLLHILICLVIEDVYSYTTHRWSHINSWLYKYTHRHHHHYHAPISWSATATHPAEFLIQNIIPSTLGNLLLGSHVITMWIFVVVRIYITVEAHSGYSFPWSLDNLIPIVNILCAIFSHVALSIR